MNEHKVGEDPSKQPPRCGRGGILALSTLGLAGCLRSNQNEERSEPPERDESEHSETDTSEDAEDSEESDAGEESFDTEPGPRALPINPPLSWVAPSGGSTYRGVLEHTVEPADDAALQWIREGEPTEFSGMSPIATDEHIALRVDFDLGVIDAATGDLQWKAGETNAIPVDITDETVTAVVSARDGTALVTHALSDGTERDRFEFEESLINPTATDEGIYYTNYDSDDDRGEVIARNRANGEVRWRVQLENARPAIPSVNENAVYVGVKHTDADHEDVDGSVVAIDRETGTEQWRVSELQRVQSPVAVTEDAVFAASEVGPGLTAIEADSGDHRWTINTRNGSGIPPVVDDEAVYFGTSDQEFYRIDRTDGTPDWRIDLPGRNGNAEMALVGRTLYVPRQLAGSESARSVLTAVNADTGEVVWDVRFDNRFTLAVVPTGNTIFIGTTDLHNSDAPDRLLTFAAGPTED